MTLHASTAEATISVEASPVARRSKRIKRAKEHLEESDDESESKISAAPAPDRRSSRRRRSSSEKKEVSIATKYDIVQSLYTRPPQTGGRGQRQK